MVQSAVSVNQRRHTFTLQSRSVQVVAVVTYKAPRGPPFSMARPELRNKPYKTCEYIHKTDGECL